MNDIANQVANQFLAYVAIFGSVTVAIGFYASHQHRKYAAPAEAEREAASHPAS